ncbi:MAG TPA: DUF1254 domain-containing protein [Pseudolabrys sp.]|nr:DUF1254 domain-containing protein [Pseudolabrys sp.]
MKKISLLLSAGLLATFAVATASSAQTTAAATNEAEARAIAQEAYIYLYPLVTMDVTRKQLINSPPSTGIGGPTNTFVNIPTFPTADMRAVVRPNFDTLYSSAWVDLTRGPVVVSAPDTNGRYYLLPMLDMWTDVFASPGWRTTGTKAANFLLVPPRWNGKVPAGMTRVDAPTPYVWIIGRTKTDGPQDYEAVHAVQKGYKITPLSGWGKPAVAVKQVIDPSVDTKTPPKSQVDTMQGAKFFVYAAELLKLHPPHDTDQPIIARLKRIGFEAGKSFNVAKLDATVQKAIADAPGAAQKLMEWKTPSMARVANGWSMNTDTMGVYGNYYLKRAIVAQAGLGANVPEDAIYPLNLADDTGKPLDGANKYAIRFASNELPPVDAFWSITLYDSEGFQVANSINRFAVSSWMPFKRDADGSLTLYFQNESPGADREANWLPAPKGPFNLTMRLYAPKSEALTGLWNPPPVTKVQQRESTGAN